MAVYGRSKLKACHNYRTFTTFFIIGSGFKYRNPPDPMIMKVTLRSCIKRRRTKYKEEETVLQCLTLASKCERRRKYGEIVLSLPEASYLHASGL